MTEVFQRCDNDREQTLIVIKFKLSFIERSQTYLTASFVYISVPPSRPAFKIVTPELWSISVTWQGLQYDGGSPVLDYKLTLLDSNNIVQQNQSQIRGTNHTFFNLQQNRQYNIVLEARNAIGYSKPSNNIVRTRKAGNKDVI